MKQLLLKQLTTKRLILLVLSFIMLMPSTAWGDEYTYDSDFYGWDGNSGTYSECLTIDFQNSTTVYSPDQFSNISKVEIVAGGASQIYSSFAVSVNGSDYQSIVSTTGNGYVIPSNVDYDTYTFEFTPEETPQYIKISAQYDAMSGTQGWVYIQSVTVYYTEEKKTTEFYAALSDDGKTVTFYYDDQKKSRGGQNIFSTLDRFYAEATTAVIDKSMAKYAPADMTTWFLNCSALTSITGLDNLNTTEVRNMQSLFQGCSSLTSLDLTCFDTSNLINMNGMFAYCSSLKTVDLSSFNTSKVTDMGGLFAYCSDLETIYVDETRWSTAAVTSENNGNSGLFYECGPLVGGNGTAYYDTYDTDGEDLEYARVDKPGQPGYLTHKSAVENDPEPYAVLSNENTVLTFYYDGKKKNRHGLSVGPFTVDFPLSGMQSWADACSSVTSVVFDASFANCTSITSTAGWFFGFRNLKTITGIENLKTDNVKDMSFMFYACSNLTSLDVSSFNTANVTKMVYMFGCCYSLTSLDLSSFNTANVTEMGTMFDLCSSLTSLDVSSFNTTRVESMAYMFANCDNLTNVDISSFYTPNLKDLRYMFYACPKLTTIYAGQDWSTAKVTTGNNMFEGCNNLIGEAGTTYNSNRCDYTYARIDGGTSKPGYFTDVNAKPAEGDPEPYAVLSNDNTALIFYYDDKKTERGGYDVGPFDYDSYEDKRWGGHDSDITTVVFDVSFANCTSITSTAFWFSDFNNLTTITGIEKLKTDNVTDMNSMFECCSSLTSLDLSHFNTTNVTTMAHMFRDCVVSSLDLSCFNTSNVTSMTGMFSGCSNLTTIYVGDGWTTKNITWGEFTFSNCHLLVGGSGTRYESDHNDYTYAHIDGGTANPGYLTKKDGSATGSCDMSEIPTNNAYYAATSFLCERGVLDGSKVGGKYLVENPLLRKHLANISFRGLFTLKGREIPSTFVSDQYPDVYDDLKSDSSYYQAAKVLLYLDYGDGITPFDRDRDGFFPNGNEARINILKELMEAFNIKPDTIGTDNPFPNDPDITSLLESSTIKMGYVRKAAKLSIITTENEQFRPYDDCLRGEAFLMLARIIQKIEAGEITDPNPQESDFLDPNSGTGTAEPYAVLSDDNTVLTFYYDNKKESRGGIDINNTYIMPGSSSPYGTATTASFDASFANYKPTSTAYWFQRCSSLTTITGMENLKTGNVTSMECMFSYCSSLTSLDLSNFNTVSVTTMSEMFYGCSGLTSLDVSSFNTANVTNMLYMFRDCSHLSSLDVSGFNTSNVTDMSFMFYNCSGLTSLDLSNFNTANVTLMGSMFSGCSGLITIYVGNGWTTTSLTTGAWMFEGCTNLVGGAGTVVVEANNYKYTIDGGADNPGYFTEKSATPVEDDAEPYAVLSDDNTVLTFYYDGKKESRGGLSVGPFTTNFTSSWYRQRESITNVVFDESFANCTSLTSTAKWFDGLQNLSSITGISNLKTDNVTNMESMFCGCFGLTSLDVTGFKTDNVTNMNNMFYDCSGLASLDVTGFKTDNVTDMGGMFDGCSGLTSLDVTGFKTDNVTNMFSMFSGCSGLTSLDVTGFKTDKVTSVAFMFYGCSGLTSLDVTGFKTDNVIYMSGMFSCCSGLKSLDVTGFKTDNVTNMRDMFYICSSLTSLDVTGFKTDNVMDMQDMFSGCIALTSLDVTGFKTKNVTVMGGMFGFCTSLTSLDVTNFETDNVEYMTQMFDGCRGLTSLDLTGFKTDNVTSMHWMFRNCPSLKTIYVGDGWSTAKVQNGENMFEGCTSLVGGAGTTYDHRRWSG